MAEKIELQVNLKDNASKGLDPLIKKTEKLDGTDVEIIIEAKVSKALAALDEVATEAKKAEAAAEALSKAIGPELSRGANMDAVVADFQRMGLSLDEITDNADRLGGKLKEVGQTSTGGIEGAFRKARGGVDDLGRSADSSKSALANMVGNSAQDIGAVGGVAGSAGVAIGQMAEYMADATLSGEGLRSVLASFATVAGPIAAMTLALQAISDVSKRFGDTQERQAAGVETFADALKSGESAAGAYKDSLIDMNGVTLDVARNQSKLQNVVAELDSHWYSTGLGIMAINKLLGGTSEETKNITPLIVQAGIGLDRFAQLSVGSADQLAVLEDQLKNTTLSAKEQDQILDALRNNQEDHNKAVENAVTMEKLQGGAIKVVNDEYEKLLRKADPLASFTDKWETVFQDFKDGRLDTQAAADAMTFLTENLGLSREAVEEIIRQHFADELTKQADAGQKAADEIKRQAEETKQLAINIADAQTSIAELASTQATIARRRTAISDAFDIADVAIDTLGNVHKINDAIRELGEFLKEKGVPKLFDPNDINATPFLDKIRSLREPIQQQISDAFATGGPVAAQQTADAYVTQIVNSMKGKLTADQVRKSLGLDDFTATLKVAIDKASLAEATSLLEILTGVGGETPWTANIKLALAAGTLSADAAKVLIAQQLGKIPGINVPVELTTPTAANKQTVQAEADRWAREHPATINTNLAPPSAANQTATHNQTQNSLNKTPVVQPVSLDTSDFLRRIKALQTFIQANFKNAADNPMGLDSGGTAGGLGGIAGERGPEILDGRYLVTQPTYIPPGTRVTSRKRTERILRMRGARGLKGYDSGGVVPGATTININAAVVGNRYDVMRAVSKANRDKQRLLGSRG